MNPCSQRLGLRLRVRVCGGLCLLMAGIHSIPDSDPCAVPRIAIRIGSSPARPRPRPRQSGREPRQQLGRGAEKTTQTKYSLPYLYC